MPPITAVAGQLCGALYWKTHPAGSWKFLIRLIEREQIVGGLLPAFRTSRAYPKFIPDQICTELFTFWDAKSTDVHQNKLKPFNIKLLMVRTTQNNAGY